MGAKPICEGKRALIFGVANERSIAWGITRALHAHGARCALTYVGDAIEKRARPLGESVDAELILPCDVTDPDQVTALFERVNEHWGGLDILIHSIAFAHREDLDGRFMDTTREGFLKAMEISVFSLVNLTRHAEPLLRASNGNILTMTYYGAEKVIPNYNVMGVAKAALESAVRYLAADLGPDGIRVNAISAGPIRTLAASGVRGFKSLMAEGERRAPLKRSVTIDEVGNAALYLCSDLGAGVTGEVLHVDAGYNVTGG